VCGTLSPAAEEGLRALSCEQLEKLAEALLDFRSPTDLEAWFKEH